VARDHPSRTSDRSPRGGKYLQGTWISLDGAACRLDAPDEVD
jgi:hypothetical protein